MNAAKLLGLLSLMFLSLPCQAIEYKFGSNWVEYSFSTKNPEDITRGAAIEFRDGWGHQTSAFISYKSLFDTKAISFDVGSHLNMELSLYGAQFLHVTCPLKISENILFIVTLRWKENGENKIENINVLSSQLGKWIVVSRPDASENNYVVFLESSPLSKIVFPQLDFPEGAEDLTLSVCYVRDRTALSFYDIKMRVAKEPLPEINE